MGAVTNPEVTFFTHRFSSYAQPVQIALLEKGISFKPIFVDFSNKPEELKEANPIYAKVPTIIHYGKPVAESLIILQYLDDAFPEKVPLMPKGALEKSKVRFWADYIHKNFSSISDGFKLEPEKQATNEVIVKFLKTLDHTMVRYSAEGPFFTGEQFGFLDLVLSPLTSSLIILEKVGGVIIPGPDEIPRLHKWIEVTKAHPSVSSTLPSGEETLEFMVKYFKQAAAAAASGAPQ